MWVIKTMHDGKVIIQSTGMLLNCNTRKYMYFKFYFSLYGKVKMEFVFGNKASKYR